MFAYLIAEPGLPLLFLYLHLLSLNKDDHFLITSTYSLLIYTDYNDKRAGVVLARSGSRVLYYVLTTYTQPAAGLGLSPPSGWLGLLLLLLLLPWGLGS